MFFNKNYLLKLPDFKNSKESSLSFIEVVIKVDKRNLELLLEGGYEPLLISQQLSYKYPEKWIGKYPLYAYLVFQDILKGRVFNSERYAIYCLLKTAKYNQQLTEEESEAVQRFTSKSHFSSTDEGINNYNTPTICIAFAAEGTGVGKTMTGSLLKTALEQEGIHAETLTIAERLREIGKNLSELIFKDSERFFEKYSEKNLEKKFGNEEVAFKTRDFICDLSVLIEYYYGSSIWGTTTVERIKNLVGVDVVIIDDLRRKEEEHVLREHFGENFLTVYLAKDGYNKQTTENLSKTAQSFENNYSKETCDLSFTFKEDWSNSDDLINLLKERITNLTNKG